jgi:hypothetical protein
MRQEALAGFRQAAIRRGCATLLFAKHPAVGSREQTCYRRGVRPAIVSEGAHIVRKRWTKSAALSKPDGIVEIPSYPQITGSHA